MRISFDVIPRAGLNADVLVDVALAVVDEKGLEAGGGFGMPEDVETTFDQMVAMVLRSLE